MLHLLLVLNTMRDPLSYSSPHWVHVAIILIAIAASRD